MGKRPIICVLFLWLLMIAPSIQAETTPSSPQQAQQLFVKACQLSQAHKFKEAQALFEVLVEYYAKRSGIENKRVAMMALNNLGLIHTYQGRLQQAKQTFLRAESYAQKLKDWGAMADFNFKLGLVYERLAADSHKRRSSDRKKLAIYAGSYTPPEGPPINVQPWIDPFSRKFKEFKKNITLMVRDDFEHDKLLIPGSVELNLIIKKRGYYDIKGRTLLLPDKDTDIISDVFKTKPRRVRAQVKEDFYNHEVIPDEINLKAILPNNKIAEAKPITDSIRFKPGPYLLTIKKKGYMPIEERLIIYPDEDDFFLDKLMISKPRRVTYLITGDYVNEPQLIPDKITLNDQPITENAQFKPGRYRLAIRKEGYEPINESLIIEPSEEPYVVKKAMKTLERDVIFNFTSDYEKGLVLPDEVTFNRTVLKNGESVKPNMYQICIRKHGYDTITVNKTIPPLSKPYILKGKLLASPRMVEHNIIAKFPRGKKIIPDRLTLNGKDASKGRTFKPGKYEMVICKNGYHPVKKMINIPPDVGPYVITHLVTPKPRLVIAQISQDVPHKDPDVTYKLVLSCETIGRFYDYHKGLQVEPQNYLMTLTMPGYEPERAQFLIEPKDEPFYIKRKLIAMNRKVTYRITAEWPKDARVIPDEISLDSKPLKSNFSIKPGHHDLIIMKEGYEPIRERIFIGASDKEYLLFKKLITVPRSIKIEVKDSIDRRQLTPDEITLGGKKIKPGSTFKLKPGEYELTINLKGYHSLQKREKIPVGAGLYVITKYLTASSRDIKSFITGDFDDKPLEPDVYTLNKIPVTEKTAVAPGTYELVIRKKGYQPLIKKIVIAPNPEAYIIREKLISKTRKLILDIRSIFPPEKVLPDKILFNKKPVKSDDAIKPGIYELVIEKKGYKTIKEKITVEPSEDPYVLHKVLESIPRLVTYEIFGDFQKGVPLIPDEITLNDKTVDGKTTFPPGKYTLKIAKKGYEPKERSELILPADEPYRIRDRLISLPREVVFNIIGEWPREQLEVDMITFNGEEYDGAPIKPGSYELEIMNPGFYSLKKRVVITPDVVPFKIEEMMKTKPVLIEEKIIFDVDPGELGRSYKITMAPVTNPTNIKIMQKGDKLKPGQYHLKIMKEAYRTIDERIRIFPRERPYRIERVLQAKLVTLILNITHDIPPPPDLKEYTVSLIDVKTGIPRKVVHGGKIKPGHYFLDVQQPGYKIASKQEIKIPPMIYPYEIREKLIAQDRGFSFAMEYNGIMIKAEEILINGKKITAKDKFQPGTEVEMVAKFKKFATVRQKIKIKPGQGPQVAKVKMTPLTKFEFELRTRKDSVVLDGIQYQFEYYADDKPIEDHHITKEVAIGRIFFTVMAPKETKKFKLVGGYLYNEVPIERIYSLSHRFRAISVPKLIDHLEQVQKINAQGVRAALKVVSKLTKGRSWRMVRALNFADIDQLTKYIESWKLVDPRDIDTRKKILAKLERLKKSG